MPRMSSRFGVQSTSGSSSVSYLPPATHNLSLSQEQLSLPAAFFPRLSLSFLASSTYLRLPALLPALRCFVCSPMRVSAYLCPDNQAPFSKLPIKWTQTNASYVIMVRCAKHFRLVICLITCRLQPTENLNLSLSQEQLSLPAAFFPPCLPVLSLICLSVSACRPACSLVFWSVCLCASARIFAQTTKYLSASCQSSGLRQMPRMSSWFGVQSTSGSSSVSSLPACNPLKSQP